MQNNDNQRNVMSMQDYFVTSWLSVTAKLTIW